MREWGRTGDQIRDKKHTSRIPLSRGLGLESMSDFNICQPCDGADAEPCPKRRKRDHVCDFQGCNAAFDRSGHLANHKRTHTGDKPYVCEFPECTAAFARSGALVRHRRTHTGERPFACEFPECTAAFATSCSLAKHKRTHTGEKPYACEFQGCTKAFAESCALTKHKRTHTGEKPYACEFQGCHAAFSESGHLANHIRTHTGERPYACDVPGCTAAFAQSGTLERHIMRCHTDTYIARRKVQEERVCAAIVARGWTEWFHPETMPPPGSFKREKRIDFQCVDAQETWCRIDFVLGMDTGYVFLEVDESQHRFGYDAMLGCDMKRMAKVMASVTIEAGTSLPNVFWLRYNPHAWHVDGALRSVPKAEREAWLCAYLSDLTLHRRLTIGYAYYDSTDGALEVLNNDEYHPDFAEVAVNLVA